MHNTWAFGTLAASFSLAVVLTWAMIFLARRWRVLDDPSTAPERKRHTRPTPLLGGLAIILTEVIVWGWLAYAGQINTALVPMKYIIGLSLASVLLAVGGILDDVRRQSPGRQMVWPLMAALAAIVSGVGVMFITNPLGGLLYLNTLNL